MKFFKYFLGLLVFFSLTPVKAQSLVPKYSNEFMNIGIGARALSMGGAQVSSVRDVTAAYWNPAGLIGVRYAYEFSLMHAQYFAGIAKFDYVGFTTNIEEDNQIAISLIRFGVDDIPDTRFLYDANGALNYNNIQFFNAADYALLLSFARDISDAFKFGINTKIIHRNVGKFAKAWGFGLDIGGIVLLDEWRLGFMLRDITSTFNVWSHNADMLREVYSQTQNEIPINSIELTLPRFIFSVTRDFEVNDEIKLQGVFDLDFTFDGRRNTILATNLVNVAPRLGLEASYRNFVYLRAGGSNVQRIRNFDAETSWVWKPSFGLGFFLNEKFHIDYALSDIGGVSQTPYSHVFSIKVGLNELEKKYRLNKGWKD